jgi:HK97 gp10 family phage protein
MAMYFDTSDFDRKVADFMSRKLTNIKRATLNAYADEAVLRSAATCPFDTGNLRSTIRKQEVSGHEDEQIEIIAGGMRGRGRGPKYVNYAVYVHEGTSKMSPRPFLMWGAEWAARDIGEAKLQKAFK